MPELPEVEHLRRSLWPRLVGRRVEGVDLHRADVVQRVGPGGARGAAPTGRGLLAGAVVRALDRRGKELAILTEEDRRALVVRLGMTGSLVVRAGAAPEDRHTHIVWRLSDGGTLAFRDPRRFGGVRVFNGAAAVEAHWARHLGPDALTIGACGISGAFGGSRRPVKAALLDQHRLAGVGNIYADEALHRAGIHPGRPCCSLEPGEWARLAGSIRVVLAAAVEAGGSSLRDYVDGLGRRGWYVTSHAVYGRAGQPCRVCRCLIGSFQVSNRTTAFCPGCQPRGGIKRDLSTRAGGRPAGRSRTRRGERFASVLD